MPKKNKKLSETEITDFTHNEEEDNRMRTLNLIRFCMSAKYSEKYSLAYINSGLLGFTDEPLKDKQGNTITDDKGRTRFKPMEISRATYYRYKQDCENPTLLQDEIIDFVKRGFTQTIMNTKSEIEQIKRMSWENLNAETDPLKRQMILNSIMKYTVPAVTQYADALKRMVERNKLPLLELIKKDAKTQ